MASPTFAYALEPLKAQHDRSGFSCGIESLDRYLLQQAGQDFRRRVAAPFVLQDLENKRVAGYYTLCATAIELQDLPPQQVMIMRVLFTNTISSFLSPTSPDDSTYLWPPSLQCLSTIKLLSY